MQDNLNTVILIGSARENRMADRVLKWLLPELGSFAHFSIRLTDGRDFDAGGVKRRAAIRGRKCGSRGTSVARRPLIKEE